MTAVKSDRKNRIQLVAAISIKEDELGNAMKRLENHQGRYYHLPACSARVRNTRKRLEDLVLLKRNELQALRDELRANPVHQAWLNGNNWVEAAQAKADAQEAERKARINTRRRELRELKRDLTIKQHLARQASRRAAKVLEPAVEAPAVEQNNEQRDRLIEKLADMRDDLARMKRHIDRAGHNEFTAQRIRNTEAMIAEWAAELE